MFEIFLMSKKPTTLILNNAKISVSNTDTKILQFEKPKDVSVDFYLSNEASFVYHSNCSFEEGYKTDSKFLKIVKINDYKYIFVFLLKNECFLQKKCKKVVKNGNIFNFYQNGLVEIETENAIKFSQKYDFEILDADVLEIANGYFAIKLFGKNETEMCVVLNQYFAEVVEFESCIVESTDSGFKVLTNLYDIAGHGLVEVFDTTEDIKKVDEFAVYMFDAPKNDFNIRLLPTYFLECIKAKDFGEASNCLSADLKVKAKPEHLSQYFGDFVDIWNLENKIYLEYVDQFNNHFLRSFNFNVSNGKIVSIS